MDALEYLDDSLCSWKRSGPSLQCFRPQLAPTVSASSWDARIT